MGKLLPGGWRELRERNHALAVNARRLLCERLEVEPPCPKSMLGSMATIPLPARLQGSGPATISKPDGVHSVVGKIASEQVRLHEKFGIEVPFSRIGDPKLRYLRVSAQLYNCLAEYEYLASALRTFWR